MCKKSIIVILNIGRSGLKDLKAADADENSLALDHWEVSELINISRYAAHMRAEKSENFRLKDTDLALFKDSKLSPACAQMQHARGDITTTPPSSLTSSHSPNVN